MWNLVIVGGGGFGRELAAMLPDVFSSDRYRLKGYLGRAGDTPGAPTDAPILGDPDVYQPDPQDRLLLAVGEMAARVRLVEELERRGGRFESFIHPRAFIAPTAEFGPGAVIYPMAVVSNAARLGRFVHLNYFASVGHDCQVGDFTVMSPYATLNGFCQIEPEVVLSTHSTVVPGRRIGRGVKVSANSAVMRDTAAGSFVFGVPGRAVQQVGMEGGGPSGPPIDS